MCDEEAVMMRCPVDGAQLQPWSDWLTAQGLACPDCGLVYEEATDSLIA